MPRILGLLTLLFCTITTWANSPFANILNKPQLLSPEEAFIIEILETTNEQILISVKIAPGYYLYRDQFVFTPAPPLKLGAANFPEGVIKTDEFFGTQTVYTENTVIPLPVINHPKSANLSIEYRGCAPIGVCYPPMEKDLNLEFNDTTAEHTKVSNILAQQHFIIALIIFFGLGLLLAFTPCVLPMLPILSSIILGQKNCSRMRALELSTIYVLAMAATFAIAGIIAASLGASLQSSLQQPWILSLGAAFLVLLAILLLMDYPLQLPAFLQNKINRITQKQKGGTFIGVTSMGILSALVVSPCVTPPLIGALIYIAESGDILLGGSALFLLGLGMGVPLVLFSVFGAHLLPKKGPWLRGIKILFAVLLIGLAASLVMRFVPLDFMGNETQSTPAFDYIPVKTLNDVEQQLQAAKTAQQAVILDFYADWCVSCVKMEKTVFPDSNVQALLQNVRILKADVTQNDADDKALLQHFGIYGPPAFLFFSKDGIAQPDLTIIGEINAKEMVLHLQRWSH